MSFVWATAVNDLRRRWRDPLALIIWVAIPLSIATLIQLAFGGDDNSRIQATLLVDDRDQSFVSGLLIGSFDQGPLQDLILTETVDSDDGARRIEDGEASGLLIIPAGFGQAVLDQTPMTLELVTHPGQRILPGILEETIGALVDAVHYAGRIFGDVRQTILAMQGMPSTTDSISAMVGIQINQTMTRVADYMFPPVLDVRVVESAGASPDDDIDFGKLFLIGMLMMSILFVAQNLSQDLWTEKAMGTVRRAVVSPNPVTAWLLGKLIAGMILFALIASFGLLFARWVFRIDLAHLPESIGWLSLFGTALLAWFYLAQSVASSERAGSVLMTMLVIPLALIGGSFFPLEVMEPWMRAIGSKTPNGWALTELKAIMAGTMDPTRALLACTMLGAAAALALMLTSHRVRRRFAMH